MRRPSFLVVVAAMLVVAGCSSSDGASSSRDSEPRDTSVSESATDRAGTGATDPDAGSAEATDFDDTEVTRAGDTTAGDTRDDDDSDDTEVTTPTVPVAMATGAVPPIADEPPLTCPPATVPVTTSDGFVTALMDAQPGDVITLAPGTYEGKFVAATAGTAEWPIWLCGGRDAILDAGGVRSGYGLHLDGASHWRVVGFTVHDAQKGVVADGVTDTVIQGLRVEDIGDEAIHLRDTSTANVVQDNEIRRTGQRRDKFGEGVYIGTAQSNWCTISDCRPDPSNGNVVQRNDIAETTSESVDIKEGTTGGVVRDNHFDGSALSGADSWVDVKGNGWLIAGNTGVHSPKDGFQLHEIVEGAGTGNVFTANTADVDGPGYGIATTNTNGNVVRCDNKVTGAAQGLADVDCT